MTSAKTVGKAAPKSTKKPDASSLSAAESGPGASTGTSMGSGSSNGASARAGTNAGADTGATAGTKAGAKTATKPGTPRPSPAEIWQDANNRYLSASLQWLRARLSLLIVPEAPAHAEAEGKNALLAPPDKRHVQKLWTAREHASHTTNDLPPPALITLAERFGLSAFERDTLLLCAAMEFDPAIARLCAQIFGRSERNYPTFSLALSAFDDPGWDAMSNQRPLRYAYLLEVIQQGATPLTASPLRCDERIVNFIKGLNLLDERVRSLCEVLPPRASALAPSQERQADALLARLQASIHQAKIPVVQLLGADAASRAHLAQSVCDALGRHCYQLRLECLPQQLAEVETLARLWQRESLLLPVALLIETEDLAEAQQTALRHFLTQDVGVTLVGVRDTELALGSHSFTVDCSKPDALEQRSHWQIVLESQPHASLRAQAASLPPQLAGQFDLNLPDIERIADQASHMADVGSGEAWRNRIWDACRDVTRPRLDNLAQRLATKATWDDLVLPEEHMQTMRQIAAQVRERHKVYGEWGFDRKMNRGFGISALFTGESGTGKTMAAEVIANALRLNLYRIDLSQVVSKYIGETEKNLRKLFDAAEQGGAILFFDEADALFGKRSEVKDSHDRYANIEINYLLQRMESFSGLAILASNIKSALDPAFMRRLRFIVHFPYPGLKERLAIWQRALPAGVPTRELDFAHLARLNIAGGNIHSIALNAAFVAADLGKPLDMTILLAAARAELKKLDKPVVEAEFRPRTTVEPGKPGAGGRA